MIPIILIILPFLVLSDAYIKSHTIGLILAILLIYSVSMVREKAIKIFGVYVVCWTVFLHFSALADPSLKLSASASLMRLTFIIFALAIYVAVARSKQSNEFYFNAICIGAILQAALGLLQIFGVDPFFSLIELFTPARISNTVRRAIGTLGNPDFYGGYIAISLPFFFRKYWKKFIPFLLITVLPLDPANASSGAVFAIIVGAVFFYRLWWVALIGFIGGGLFFIFDYDSIINGPRLEWWANIWAQITLSWKNFIFGLGPGAYTGLKWPIHNEWLELMFHYGAIGVLIVLSILARLTEKRDPVLVAAILAAAANCLANYPMHLAPSGLLILIILGLLERSNHGGRINIHKHIK